jgi:hypothetical protein
MRRIDSIYCAVAAIATVSLAILAMVRLNAPSQVATNAVRLTVYLVIGHFLFGVTLQVAMRRFFRPIPVVLCMLATGTFTAVWFYAVLINPPT